MEFSKNQKVTFLLVMINLLIVALYQLSAASEMYSQLASAVYIVGHCVILTLLSLIYFVVRKQHIALGFVISAGIVLLIGAGTCAML